MTLVEVMIAAAILAVALVFTMGSVVSIAATSRINEDQAIAAATVSTLLEELRALSFDQLMAYQPLSSSDLGAAATVTVQCYDASGAALALPIDTTTFSTPLPNPLEVQVIITWLDEMGRPYSKQATALFGR